MFDFHEGDRVWMSCWMGGREGRYVCILLRLNFLASSLIPRMKENNERWDGPLHKHAIIKEYFGNMWNSNPSLL